METRELQLIEHFDGTYSLRCLLCGQIVQEDLPSMKAVFYLAPVHKCEPQPVN